MTHARLAKLRERLAHDGLDAILISKPENQAYLSGFTGSNGLLLVSATEALLFTDFRYAEQAAEQAPAFTVEMPEGALIGAAAKIVEADKLKKVGFESDFLTVDAHKAYTQVISPDFLVAAGGLVEEIRMIKDEAELDLMRKAAQIADEAFAAILPLIKAGAREWDLAVELEYQMKKRGAEGLAFEIIAASGVRSSMPHGRASAKIIEQGDLVTFDFGAIYQGYCSDMTRTLMVGEPTAEQRRIYEIVLEAEKRGLAACKAGITGHDLDAVCRDYILEHGYGPEFGHSTGHGVGRYIHEGPRLRKGSNQVLQPGMIVTIEPGIYLPGWGGVRIEDMVLVTETGCESLTKTTKDLLVL
ncbi:MAG TPA: Xaa-Pro peptidase family protein [Symbiobacteriaceae bacterium]|nr:Xaa-Pro peptidase family protein [Symbiobacteriaceae bacterium]